jgi:hypothetical protein
MTELRDLYHARALHSEREMEYRRQALIARAMGRNPEPAEIAVEHHHRAVVALSQEIDAPPFVVRRVG